MIHPQEKIFYMHKKILLMILKFFAKCLCPTHWAKIRMRLTAIQVSDNYVTVIKHYTKVSEGK